MGYVPNGGASLIGRLATELREQWESNHAEHCTNMPHVAGDLCHWPIPLVLTEAERVLAMLAG